jgi:hypothetical protein
MEGSLAKRVSSVDWDACFARLNLDGWSILPELLNESECDSVAGLYDTPSLFRSHVVMSRHGFGRGEYRYFAYPLPSLLQQLRGSLYSRLAPLANEWHRRMQMTVQFDAAHPAYLEKCHKAGQMRPTPLLLRYGPGDYNCLHQDLYGEEVFPLQAAILLSDPGEDFRGGEFVVTEQRPRMQSRASVIPISKGDAVVFAVNRRPVNGTRGDYQVRMRHGVSRVEEGLRFTLGIIFHDAA